MTDGNLHITGDGFGYLATEKAYKDYRVVIEYKWGKKTDGGKYVRNSGLLLHATGPDGGAAARGCRASSYSWRRGAAAT